MCFLFVLCLCFYEWDSSRYLILGLREGLVTILVYHILEIYSHSALGFFLKRNRKISSEFCLNHLLILLFTRM